tara:strand:- start:1557 stop:1940 length:384 start_codon:yes stop_codon:yes gene_type:complete
MSIFGSNEKKVEDNTTFIFDTEKDNINQSNLAKDIKIHGSIEAKDYIEFSGNITGTIKSSTINLKPSSYVKGTITGDTVTIEGELDGDIQAKDLYIKSTAKIKGTIRYTNIDIQNGSIINADLFYSS